MNQAKHCVFLTRDEPTIKLIMAGFAASTRYDYRVIPVAPVASSIRHYPTDAILFDAEDYLLADIVRLRRMNQHQPIICVGTKDIRTQPGLEAAITAYLLVPCPENEVTALSDQLPQLQAGHKRDQPTGSICVRADRLNHRIDLSDISFLQSLREYVVIHLTDGRRIMTLQALNRLMQQLPQRHFTRIHRSYAVANRLVTAFNSREVVLGDRHLKIGGSFRVAVRAALELSAG